MSSSIPLSISAATLLIPAKNVVVSTPEGIAKAATRPAHHMNDSQTKFTNPWPSWRYPTFRLWASYFWKSATANPSVPVNIASLIPTQKPTWGVGFRREDMKATWLGHACFLVELPTPSDAARGARVIFDPVFQHRCSPVQWAGPERFTPAPCEIEEIPSVDAIVLSHNHYDHTDTHTLRSLVKKHDAHVFAPLGNRPYLLSIGIPQTHIHILDWWDNRTVSLSIPSSSSSSSDHIDTKFKLTCTPAQHTSNRGLFDRGKTLWASFALEDLNSGKKAFFGGDTGYRTIRDGEDAESVPVCPAFKEIGEKLGPFDLAMLPIGAYDPRALFSGMHAHPADSVRIFQDIKAKKGLGMHWGTWILTTEPLMEPPAELRRHCDKAGITQDEFDICGLGETRPF
ncbi:Metallo-hydrolase/oxidoreductase [Cristinia sonorae]|uniref:Metallo-hydrolase/oxidoreductase n=1 Tax=Cristinia sonorae TaxID=1940300 RepID=A0A8K0UUK8_9AGAR|nr:Metallo-hydrolase/oxidoreductase [Cristinia sonorae]